MAVFKCKMCGGALEIEENQSVVTCGFCGTQQTVPKSADENLQNIFNRANLLRLKSEFDKAEKLYEKIIQADQTQAEAYWGLILCKYGIEYVEDPTTFKRIPTCHRASYDAVVSDENYKLALEYADSIQRIVYEEQAKAIDEIQKGILAIAQNEEPYDVFICYKESDESGKRTQDSVIANDIYYQLKQEGFKVFYSAITLEDKLGRDYEPIIFAALNSAKVMLVLGTKEEYFNAVWVKNEWSRFLRLMSKDRNKLLIPCYKNIDAYELPEEFAHLQAQDMSKIGFINDIVRGIKKVVNKQTVVKETVIPQKVEKENSENKVVANYIKRAWISLEDSDFKSANDFAESALNIDAECGEAYLIKALCAFEKNNINGLATCNFEVLPDYIRARRYGNEDLQQKLDLLENENKYLLCKKTLQGELNEEKYNKEKEQLQQIIDYKDCRDLLDQLEGKWQVTLQLQEKERRDLLAAQEEKERQEEIRKEQLYNEALEYCKIQNRESLLDAIELLKGLSKDGYKDSKQRLEEAKELLRGHNKKRRKISAIVISTVLAVIIAFSILSPTVIRPARVNNLIEKGEYAKAVRVGKSTQFVVPDGVTEIPDYAFFDCDSLTSIIIPNSVTSIGNYAFSNCSKLTSITIPNSVASIGDYAFFDCSSLTSITIPNSATKICASAFYGCPIEKATIPTIAISSIINSALKEVEITSSESIGDWAFSDCDSLKSITIGNSVTSIGESAFYSCDSLTSVTIGNSVTSIGDKAFSGCS